jgi:molybdate transport system substrate-binding protein
VAIANPEHAPYGRAAVEALRRSGIYDRVKSTLVLGENVAQAAQFTQTGNADAAIIALSLTRAPAMRATGTAVELPADLYAAIRQTGVVISRSSNQSAAGRFLAFLTEPDTAALMQASGFGGPP